jgi:hypothetical protein
MISYCLQKLPCSKGVHHKGPVLTGIHDVNQFQEIEVHSFSVKLTSDDRYVQLRNGDIVAVQNIVVDDKKILQDLYMQDVRNLTVFSYLQNSKDIGVVKFTKIGRKLKYIPVSEVVKKYVVLPYRGSYVAVPLIHNN